ncbi:unnamed protein product [Owenia fusiformis]|uniref:Proline-rich transmembrane protein 3/4 domain-containing protein n=1 Tax=Owenia fusiformis TaxID=6347 RepID=A0A8S4NE72_OWEFU|nr:unnamed protein product [Owenia fusiformis]
MAKADPEPEVITEPEPKITTEPEPEIISEPEPTSQPEPVQPEPGQPEPWNISVAESEPEPEGEAWPEPAPEWDKAMDKWKGAWYFHVYFFTLLYIIIFFIATLSLVRLLMLYKRKNVKRPLTTSLNIMLCSFGLLRTVSLLLDPYSAYQHIQFEISHIIWTVGFPCLTTAFSIPLLALLDSTKVYIAPPKFQKLSSILVITLFHFVLVITTDTLVFMVPGTSYLLVICQVLYVVWGLSLAGGYAFVAYKISRNLKATADMHQSQDQWKFGGLLSNITISAVVGVCLTVTHLYGAFGVFSIFTSLVFAPPWPWWAFQTLLRTIEVAMSFLIFTVSAKVRASKDNNDTPKKSILAKIKCGFGRSENKVGSKLHNSKTVADSCSLKISSLSAVEVDSTSPQARSPNDLTIMTSPV